MKKRRFKISADKGKTWKWRWVDIGNFDPASSTLKQGDWIETVRGIRIIRIIHGKLDAAEPVKNEDEYQRT